MFNTKQEHPKSIHTLINIGLITFLIIVATIGMLSLSHVNSSTEEQGVTISSPTKEKVMICAIGKCLLV